MHYSDYRASRSEALLPAPVGTSRFVIRATRERGVGVPPSRSLSTASREASESLSEATNDRAATVGTARPQWLPTANARRVRVLDGRPIDFLEPDRPQMLALPPVPPVVETMTSVRLGRDYYIRVAGNDYSVDPNAIGQLVDVRTTLTRITVSRSGRLLADHGRCWAARQTLTDPDHVVTAAVLRHQFQHDPPAMTGDQLVRDLADYDRAFGVDFTSSTTDVDGEVA